MTLYVCLLILKSLFYTVSGGAEFAAAHLDGVFCFTVLDCLKGEVAIARDTYGVRPGFT